MIFWGILGCFCWKINLKSQLALYPLSTWLKHNHISYHIIYLYLKVILWLFIFWILKVSQFNTLNLIFLLYFCYFPRFALNNYNTKFRLFHPFIDIFFFFSFPLIYAFPKYVFWYKIKLILFWVQNQIQLISICLQRFLLWYH